MEDPQNTQAESLVNRRIAQAAWAVIGLVAVYVIVMAVGWFPSGEPKVIQGQDIQGSTTLDTTALSEQINPKDGYNLSISYGNLGPQLLASGVIDYEAFAAIYQNAGSPLTAEQIEVLKNGSDR